MKIVVWRGINQGYEIERFMGFFLGFMGFMRFYLILFPRALNFL